MPKPLWKGWTTPEEYVELAQKADAATVLLKSKIDSLVERLQAHFPDCYNKVFLAGSLSYCRRVLIRGLYYGYPAVLPVIVGFVSLAEAQCTLPCSRRWHKRDLEYLDIVFQVVEDQAVATKLYPRLEDMTLEDFGLGGKRGASTRDTEVKPAGDTKVDQVGQSYESRDPVREPDRQDGQPPTA